MTTAIRLPGMPKRKVLRIATGCADAAQFAAVFARFCEADGCFVPTTAMRPVGLETVFALQLADGRPQLRGVGVVRAAWRDAANPYGRPGLFLGFRRLTGDSRALVTQLIALRGSRAHSDTVPGAEPAESAMATVAMLPMLDGVPIAIPTTANDLTEKCEPAFADCAVDEPPRAAIATILGVAPLPKVQTAVLPRAPAARWPWRGLALCAAVFAATFALVFAVS